MSENKEQFEFTADQIGSEILERFSQDIYQPRAIIRELVKNASDSYAQLEKFIADHGSEYDDIEIDRSVFIKATSAEAFLIIEDHGLGLDKSGLELLISIALTEKRDIPNVHGHKGIGFWSAYTGADTITILTTKLGDNRRYRLKLNTSRMRAMQGPNVSIGRIMNDPDNVSLYSEAADPIEHGTQIIITALNEDSRLKHVIEDESRLRTTLLESCANRIDGKSMILNFVKEFYQDNRIPDIRVYFQGTEIVREIPNCVDGFRRAELKVSLTSGQEIKLGEYWHCTNTNNERIPSQFAGIRLFWNGYPIGAPNLYSDLKLSQSNVEVTRPDLLYWHIGEVHLANDELRPDASGELVRDSVVFQIFQNALRKLYAELVSRSFGKNRKSKILSDYRKIEDQLKKDLMINTPTEDQKKSFKDRVEPILKDNQAAKGHINENPTSKRSILQEEDVKKTRQNLTSLIKEVERKWGTKVPIPTSKTRTSRKILTSTDSEDIAQIFSEQQIPKNRAIALIITIREEIEKMLGEEPDLRDYLISKIDELLTTL